MWPGLMDLVANMKEIMEVEEVSICEMARRACVSRQAIHNFFKNGVCNIGNLARYADSLGCDLHLGLVPRAEGAEPEFGDGSGVENQPGCFEAAEGA